MSPHVVVSVVSGADPDAIVSFIRSLWATSPNGVDLTTVAVDNSGHPGLADILRHLGTGEGSGRLEVVENPSQRGFAANHNAVMSTHEADYYLIANDDVVVEEGALETLVASMERPDNATVAVASPQLLNEDGSIQGSTYGFPSAARALVSATGIREARAAEAAARVLSRLVPVPGRTRYWAHDQPTLVDSVRGAFVLVRAAAVLQVGLMDEISMVGGEELEWHRRMATAGWQVAFVPEARVTHVGAATVSGDARLRAEYLKGLLNYFQKHGSRVDVGILRAGAVVAWFLRLAWLTFRRGELERDVARSCLSVAAGWPRLWRAAREAGAIRSQRLDGRGGRAEAR